MYSDITLIYFVLFQYPFAHNLQVHLIIVRELPKDNPHF